MNIPEGTLNLIIGGVFGFSTKVLFGLTGPSYVGSHSARTGTLTGTAQAVAGTTLQARRSGGNIQIQGSGSLVYVIL